MRLTDNQYRALREAVAAGSRELVETIITHIVAQEVRQALVERAVLPPGDRPWLASAR